MLIVLVSIAVLALCLVVPGGADDNGPLCRDAGGKIGSGRRGQRELDGDIGAAQRSGGIAG